MEFFNKIVEILDQYGLIGLIIMSFAEASFFPIPPDVLLIPMGISNPDRAILYAGVTTVSSVAGAIFGWWIGKKFGRKVLRLIVSEDIISKADRYFNKYGGQTLFFTGFTPIPFKVFTILAGISQVKLKDVIIWSLLGRGARFLLEGVIIMYFGDRAVQIMNDYFPWITLVGGLVTIVIILFMSKKSSN
ncbi:YqaA family protein [Robertmurraya korlensis]|uniref:YqaA family protein n=1 Tax=Robertmurraya korlensis TaxID=519977 RepID=UPI000825213B|nr:YqaA family protein [Robertmurraya korlensis]